MYQLMPSNGNWTLNALYNFAGQETGPQATLVMDAAGNLYGTTLKYENGYGEVFKRAPSGGNWVYVIVHEFSGSDGEYPISNVVFDSKGNLYGTTSSGRAYGYGVVWEITP